MKRVKRSEVVPLRRSARTRAWAQEPKAEALPTVAESVISDDNSDCIVLKETIAPGARDVDFVTSTPTRGSASGRSCLRGLDVSSVDVHNSSEVIVISDSSKSLQVIEISDDDAGAGENEVEVLPATATTTAQNSTAKFRTPKKPLTNVVNNASLYARAPATRRSLSKLSLWNRYLSSKSLLRTRNRVSKDRRRGHRSRRKRRGARYNRPVLHSNENMHKPSTALVGENVYMEKPIVLPRCGLRPIIIDGSNVAFHHSNNYYFSSKGLEICIKYFKERGHQVTAFVPQFRMQSNKSDNPKLLDQLVRNGDVVLTPSRMVDGNPIVSYDDRFIVQTAVLKGGVIVSRDNYRDLLNENPAWAETIKYRLLQFTWVNDLLMFPKDPLGARGPSLEDFLRFG